MMRCGVLLVLALTGAGCVDKPTDFGVNVEVVTSGLDDGLRGQITTLGLHVRGAEAFDKASIGDVGAQVRSGAVRFHYVPGTRSGSLSFEIDGLDAASKIVASGAAPPVALVDGKAVDVTVTLQPGAHNGVNGAACSGTDQCASGFCVDGVCCDTACTGTCEACNGGASKGTCSPIPAGADPDNECPAKMLPTGDDAGVDDAGNPITSDGGFLFPDGGATLDPTRCKGACSGSRSCAYPGAQMACGPAFCSEVATQAAFVCDGTGACGQAFTGCADYACSTSSNLCNSQCLNNNDCAPTDFCDVTTNKCVPKRDDGQPCGPNYECKSGFCISGICCNSDCTKVPGGNCNSPGFTGQCKCSVSCDPGVGCRLWYKDGDTDGHGDQTATMANGLAKVGCESGTNAPPAAGFVTSNDDCDDANPMAFPGQTAFFQTARSNGSYDYDCNGLQETQYTLIDNMRTSLTCGVCVSQFLPSACNKQSTCTGAGVQERLACGFLAGKFCNIGITGNYQFNTGCGTGTNNYRQCNVCAGTEAASQSIISVPMACR